MRAALWAVGLLVAAVGSGDVAAANPPKLYLADRDASVCNHETTRHAAQLLEKSIIEDAGQKVFVWPIRRSVENHCGNIQLNYARLVDHCFMECLHETHRTMRDIDWLSILANYIANAALFPSMLCTKSGANNLCLVGEAAIDRLLNDLSMSYGSNGWGFAHVFHAQYHRYTNIQRADYDRPRGFGFDQHPRPLTGQGDPIGLSGFLDGAPGFLEGLDNEPCPHCGYAGAENHHDRLDKCELSLPLGGKGGLPLSAQVGVLTLLGAAVIAVGAFGLACLLGLQKRWVPPRPFSWALCIGGFAWGSALYSLAALGDWRAVFGLCSFPGY